VPQKGSVDWDFPTTALDVVKMGTYGSLGWIKRPGQKEKKAALEALEKVGMLAFKNRQISQLSGGQQQRIFLARALVQNASIYFMDEPFQGVDATTEIAIINILKELRKAGKTVSFAVLRKQSLLGDAISHAALPGIAIAFLITGAKDSNTLLLGALVSGLIGTFWIRGIITKTHLKSDTALGLILSLFFGFGMLLLTFIQRQPNANQAGLDKYLFGQAATLVESDVWMMTIVTAICLIVMLTFWKEFKILLFDADYTKTLGFNTKTIDILITSFIVQQLVQVRITYLQDQ